MQWWSTGLEVFPTLVCDLLCLWGYLRYQGERSGRWVIVSAGAIAAGLMFYEKPAYMPLYLALIRSLPLARDCSVRATLSTFWRERAMWLAYGMVLAAYAVLRESASAASIASAGSSAFGAWVEFARILWAQTLGPAAFGLRLPAAGLSTVEVGTAVGVQIAVVGLVVVSVLRKRSAWRAWLALALCVVATLVLVGQARLADFGPSIGNDPRYLADFSWLIPLTICLAFSRRDTFLPLASPTPAHPQVPKLSRGIALGAVLTVAYVATSIVTTVTLQRDWPGPQARAWEARVTTGLAQLTRGDAVPVVANANAPYYIVQDLFSPDNQLSVIVPLYNSRVHVDGPLSGPLFVLDPDGTPRRATVGTVADSLLTRREACVRPTYPTLTITNRVSTRLSPTDGPYYLRVVYRDAQPTSLPLYVDHGSGFPGAPQAAVVLPAGAGQSIAWLGEASPRGLDVQIPAGSAACVLRLDIVRLRVTG